jgi:Arc/MetJ-type ribon-helix-helix transcriptional regulator
MRQVLSLSLPATMTAKIKGLAKKRGFDSVSGYVLYLVEADKDLISEKTLLRSLKQAQKEYRQGKVVKAKSLADLVCSLRK